MLRFAQPLIALIAVGFNVVAIAYFMDWFGKTDWLMGHRYGPASSIIIALWTASASAIGIGIWIAMALFIKFRSSAEKHKKGVRWLFVVQAVLMVCLIGPAGIIVSVGVAELPRARQELPLQRIKAGEASIAELVEVLRSPDYRNRRFWAIQELKTMGPSAKPAVSALADLLVDPDNDSQAAEALGDIGPDAKPAIPALVEAIKREQGKRSTIGRDTPSTLSSLAGRALTNIGPASIPELRNLLKHEDTYVRMTAIIALGNMGTQAQEVVPALQEALNDEDEMVRQCARLALERIEGRQPVVDQRPMVN
jgi:hypothetical protein